MRAISGLMSVSRYCPRCGTDRIVNHWVHTGVHEDAGVRIVRYQCKCNLQVTDINKSDVESAAEYIDVMRNWLAGRMREHSRANADMDEYASAEAYVRSRDDAYVRVDGEVHDLKDLL